MKASLSIFEKNNGQTVGRNSGQGPIQFSHGNNEPNNGQFLKGSSGTSVPQQFSGPNGAISSQPIQGSFSSGAVGNSAGQSFGTSSVGVVNGESGGRNPGPTQNGQTRPSVRQQISGFASSQQSQRFNKPIAVRNSGQTVSRYNGQQFSGGPSTRL